jgi:hypothetical protein
VVDEISDRSMLLSPKGTLELEVHPGRDRTVVDELDGAPEGFELLLYLFGEASREVEPFESSR